MAPDDEMWQGAGYEETPLRERSAGRSRHLSGLPSRAGAHRSARRLGLFPPQNDRGRLEVRVSDRMPREEGTGPRGWWSVSYGLPGM